MVQYTRGNRNWKVIGGLLAVSLVVVLAGCGGGGGNANTTTAANTAGTNMATTNTASTSANASEGSYREAAATWGRVEKARARLDATITGNKLDEVHEAAFEVRDAVKELPGNSAALPAAGREKLDSQVKQVERLAEMLDEAGDSGNAKAVHEHHKAMDEALDAIRGLYPAGVLPGRARGDGGMPGMSGEKKAGEKGMPMGKTDNAKTPKGDDHSHR